MSKNEDDRVEVPECQPRSSLSRSLSTNEQSDRDLPPMPLAPEGLAERTVDRLAEELGLIRIGSDWRPKKKF